MCRAAYEALFVPVCRLCHFCLTGLLLLFALLPLAAQERTDTVYSFRFVTGNDMFYVPFSGNDKELARLEQCVERYRQDILAGKISLHVDGWCTAGESEADNLAMAKVRSNRVKSELIIRQGLTEACFVTKNHSGSGDYVTVRISVPKVATAAQKDERQQDGQESADTQQEQRETEESRFVAEQIRADSMVVVQKPPGRLRKKPPAQTATRSPCVPTCCAGRRSRPTWAWSGASVRHGESS